MNYIAKAINSYEPLLIEPERAKNLSAAIEWGMTAGPDLLKMVFGDRPKPYVSGRVGVIPMHGVLGRHLSPLEKACGGVDCKEVEDAIEAMEADKGISSILLHVNSPGGVVGGIPELASRVLNSSKQIDAHTDGEACSAAYWVASQAKRFYATPSSIVGSVGVFTIAANTTKAYENAGISVDVIRAGKLKAAGVAGTPMSDEQRAYLQASVNAVHDNFKGDVKAVRKNVSDADLEGQTFYGKVAAGKGLVTALSKGIVDTLRKVA